MSIKLRICNVLLLIFTITITVFALTSCGRHAGYTQVDPLVEQYFSALQNKDYDLAMSMYSEDFFKAFPKQAWRKKLEDFIQQVGDVTAYSFRNKQSDTRFSGKFFIYQYDTIHGDARAKHILTFVQPVDDDSIKLVGHRIRAKGFES